MATGDAYGTLHSSGRPAGHVLNAPWLGWSERWPDGAVKEASSSGLAAGAAHGGGQGAPVEPGQDRRQVPIRRTRWTLSRPRAGQATGRVQVRSRVDRHRRRGGFPGRRGARRVQIFRQDP
jgi:hypothetical protein